MTGLVRFAIGYADAGHENPPPLGATEINLVTGAQPIEREKQHATLEHSCMWANLQCTIMLTDDATVFGE